MPAINIQLYVIVEPQVLYSNTALAESAVNAGKQPPGRIGVNSNAKYYASVDDSLAFAIFVPDGYELGSTYVWNDVSEVWEQTVWAEVNDGDPYIGALKYYTDDTLMTGYTAYVFSDHDVFGDPAADTFTLSFNVTRQ